MERKGVELSLNFIIIAVIVIAVLLVALYLVLGGGKDARTTLDACESKGGSCEFSECTDGKIKVPGIAACENRNPCCVGV